jgi:hypothetical protein
MWLICFLPVLSNSASVWPRSAEPDGSRRVVSPVDRVSSGVHRLPKIQHIDRSRFMGASNEILPGPRPVHRDHGPRLGVQLLLLP